jgi:hypothetical protein
MFELASSALLIPPASAWADLQARIRVTLVLECGPPSNPRFCIVKRYSLLEDLVTFQTDFEASDTTLPSVMIS